MQPSKSGIKNPRHLRSWRLECIGQNKNTLGNEYLKFVIVLCFAIRYSCYMLPYVILRCRETMGSQGFKDEMSG